GSVHAADQPEVVAEQQERVIAGEGGRGVRVDGPQHQIVYAAPAPPLDRPRRDGQTGDGHTAPLQLQGDPAAADADVQHAAAYPGKRPMVVVRPGRRRVEVGPGGRAFDQPVLALDDLDDGPGQPPSGEGPGADPGRDG